MKGQTVEGDDPRRGLLRTGFQGCRRASASVTERAPGTEVGSIPGPGRGQPRAPQGGGAPSPVVQRRVLLQAPGEGSTGVACQNASCHSSAGAAGGAAVRRRGEPGAQRAPSQRRSRWVLGGAQECTRRPRLGCRHLAAAAGPGPPLAWRWAGPLPPPPAAPCWVRLCPAGPGGGGQPPSWWSQPRGPGRHPAGRPTAQGSSEGDLKLGSER